MLIALILVLAAFSIQTAYLLYYKRQIKDIGNQLSFISKHHSFKFIQTQIKPKEISELIDICNGLLQQQRELNQDFIAKSEEINSTIVSLSHDIRTPITSLDGYLQLAKRAEDVQEKTGYITMAQTRIKQIITLVDELFLYTKLQNQDYHLELESIDIMNLLKNQLFTYFDEFAQIGHEPNVILPESSMYAIGNENALERVFANIIRNYFLHGEGTLTIRYEEKEKEVLFHFSNPLKQRQPIKFDKIFTRFYKEDPSRTNHSSGLGLSIVKSLMEKMNGDVDADLKGREFCISLAFIKMKKENDDAE